MAKPLSEQLADLSISAKKAEDAVAAARKEAQDKVIARREQAHAAAAAAIQKVDRDIKSAGDSVKSAGDAVVNSWRALQAKVSADMDALNAKIALGKHKLDVKHADHHAERLEREASFAVDYAAASIEEAKYAVLDAIVGRIEAEKVKSAYTPPSLEFWAQAWKSPIGTQSAGKLIAACGSEAVAPLRASRSSTSRRSCP